MSENGTEQSNNSLISIWAWVWLGIVVGISLIATPAKFSTDTLDLATALDVGKTTFGVFGLVQWGLLIGLAILVLRETPKAKELHYLTIGIGLTLLLQATWILPALNDRVDIVMAGGELESSPIHFIFAVVEGLKILLLAAIGVGPSQLRRLPFL